MPPTATVTGTSNQRQAFTPTATASSSNIFINFFILLTLFSVFCFGKFFFYFLHYFLAKHVVLLLMAALKKRKGKKTNYENTIFLIGKSNNGKQNCLL